ncbi:MAG: hypothetical protein MPW15_27290 [Candidatus Manganitrophus sp.]|nr:hypothetical protein [Candidatus Manganitrophus sp.]
MKDKTIGSGELPFYFLNRAVRPNLHPAEAALFQQQVDDRRRFPVAEELP